MKKSTRGFTLIELIIVITLSGILMAVVTTILATGFSAYMTGKNILDADAQGRLGIERMVRDIRTISSPTSIATASSSQLVFTDFGGTSITYQLSGTTLQRNSNALADGVQSLTFNYYDKDGNTTATTSLIRYIAISLNVTQGNTNYTLSTAVYPRDLP